MRNKYHVILHLLNIFKYRDLAKAIQINSDSLQSFSDRVEVTGKNEVFINLLLEKIIH